MRTSCPGFTQTDSKVKTRDSSLSGPFMGFISSLAGSVEYFACPTSGEFLLVSGANGRFLLRPGFCWW